MDDSSSSPGRLPRAWRVAILANKSQTRSVPMEGLKRFDRQASEDAAHYLHSSELRALIARLKRERIQRGLSMADVARVTDQAHSAISRLENGQYPNPTFDTVYRYAVALGCHITLTAQPSLPDLGVDADVSSRSRS